MRKKPTGLIIASIVSAPSASIFAGVGPAANSALVTWLTRLSVVCADSSTEIRSSKTLV
jgi:hypothetical protein